MDRYRDIIKTENPKIDAVRFKVNKRVNKIKTKKQYNEIWFVFAGKKHHIYTANDISNLIENARNLMVVIIYSGM